MVNTGLIDNFVMRGVFGPGLFVPRILYTQSYMAKYSLNTYRMRAKEKMKQFCQVLLE
jgi:hypothetical protein